VLVSTISLGELWYVNRKLGAPLDFAGELERLAACGFRFVPVDIADIAQFDDLESVPEMHDRIIVALAARRGCALVTRDHQIRESGVVPVLW
jgi:PIN domain nuclease of toxin-antitoxin system